MMILVSGMESMECSAVQWNGVNGMQSSGVEWNGIDGMQCSGVEWNAVDGMAGFCSRNMTRTPNIREQFDLLFFGQSDNFHFSKVAHYFVLRGAFENGLNKKACHKMSCFER